MLSRVRYSLDGDDSPATAAVAVTSCSPPPVPPVTPEMIHDVEFSSELAPDSKHLMKPLAERLRRLSTGSMHIDVGSGTSPVHRPTPRIGTDSHSTSSSAATSGFRKCMHLFLFGRYNRVFLPVSVLG